MAHIEQRLAGRGGLLDVPCGSMVPGVSAGVVSDVFSDVFAWVVAGLFAHGIPISFSTVCSSRAHATRAASLVKRPGK